MRGDIPVFLLIGVLFVAAGLFDPYSTERPYNWENSEDVPPGHLTLEERLGYAILQRAGYGETKLEGSGVEVDSSKTTTGEVSVDFRELNHADLTCLEGLDARKAADGGTIDVRYVAVAVLAAERYNRSAVTTWVESRYADLSLRARGRLPEISLGIAQIRPATARQVLYRELGRFDLPDRDLLQLLQNDCQNARLAAAYLAWLIDSIAPAPGVDETIERATLAYNGAGAVSGRHAIMYAQAVQGAYDILRRSRGGGESSDETPPTDSTPAVKTLCVDFAVGAGIGMQPLDVMSLGELTDADSAEHSATVAWRRDAQVKGFVTQFDPGPESYLAALFARRRAWLEHELVAAGYSKERVQIRPGRGEDAFPNECSSARSSTAVIEVPLPPDTADSTGQRTSKR